MCKWILAILVLIMVVSVSSLEIHEAGQEEKDYRLKVNLYYSSMCPFSKRYLRRNLGNAIKVPEIWKLVDIKLIPYGITHKTKNGEKWEFDCMHGPSQCRGNIIHTCAIKLYEKQYYQKALPFVSCMARIVRGWDELGKECAKETGVSWEEINECSRSEAGINYFLQMAEQTQQLSPRNTYVPWMTVNQRHSQVVETDDLDQYVCRRYKGPLKTQLCAQMNERMNSCHLR